MIDPKSRTLDWILESCKINKVSDPTLMVCHQYHDGKDSS